MKTSIFIAFLALFYCNVHAQSSQWKWAATAGNADSDIGSAVCTDQNGNVIVAGTFLSPSITFNTDTLNNAGDGDIFIIKYDAQGNILWARQAGGKTGDQPYDIATGNTGNIYVAGSCESDTLAFDSIWLINLPYYDFFIAKYGASGNILWARSAGTPTDVFGYSIATDAAGNVYATGTFSSPTITFNNTVANGTATVDYFIVKYDAAGNVLWAASGGGTGVETTHKLLIDAAGNVWVAGYFNSPVLTLGPFTLTSTGSSSVFIARYSHAGNVMWAKSVAGSFQEGVLDVCADINGNIFATGAFSTVPLYFNNSVLNSMGDYDVFIH